MILICSFLFLCLLLLLFCYILKLFLINSQQWDKDLRDWAAPSIWDVRSLIHLLLPPSCPVTGRPAWSKGESPQHQDASCSPERVFTSIPVVCMELQYAQCSKSRSTCLSVITSNKHLWRLELPTSQRECLSDCLLPQKSGDQYPWIPIRLIRLVWSECPFYVLLPTTCRACLVKRERTTS